MQIGGIIEPIVDETDLARIALSCHFFSIYSVTRRGPTTLVNALFGTIALSGDLIYKGIIASQFMVFLNSDAFFNVVLPEVLAHE